MLCLRTIPELSWCHPEASVLRVNALTKAQWCPVKAPKSPWTPEPSLPSGSGDSLRVFYYVVSQTAGAWRLPTTNEMGAVYLRAAAAEPRYSWRVIGRDCFSDDLTGQLIRDGRVLVPYPFFYIMLVSPSIAVVDRREKQGRRPALASIGIP